MQSCHSDAAVGGESTCCHCWEFCFFLSSRWFCRLDQLLSITWENWWSVPFLFFVIEVVVACQIVVCFFFRHHGSLVVCVCCWRVVRQRTSSCHSWSEWMFSMKVSFWSAGYFCWHIASLFVSSQQICCCHNRCRYPCSWCWSTRWRCSRLCRHNPRDRLRWCTSWWSHHKETVADRTALCL